MKKWVGWRRVVWRVVRKVVVRGRRRVLDSITALRAGKRRLVGSLLVNGLV